MNHGGERSRIGPGRLVLVIGPSGAGKDTLIRAARERLAGDRAFVFPRRVITRPPSSDEDNSAVDAATFAKIAAAGGFAISWDAHGLSYAIPAAIDLVIAEGRTVICNVSRTVIAAARRRYEHVLAIEVTAPPEILAARLAVRARPQDGALTERIARSAAIARIEPDVKIDNTGSLDEACGVFVWALTHRLPGGDEAAQALRS
jgi:ribose 1,5-bisphosphokinase